VPHVLRAANRLVVPWKNGGGTTTEIARSPAGASLDDFDWRVSRAVVASGGPFSTFSGVDRTLVVLEGAGLRLAIAGRGSVVLARGAPPFAFAGDAEVVATLTDGPIVDLNVMSRRGRARHVVSRREVTRACELVAAGDVMLAVVETGELTMDDARLGAGDAVRCDAAGERVVASSSQGASVLVVDLWLA